MMFEITILPPNLTPVEKKKPQKMERLPEFSEKILKAEVERKAKERKILDIIYKRKAGKAALSAKNAGIVKMAGFV